MMQTDGRNPGQKLMLLRLEMAALLKAEEKNALKERPIKTNDAIPPDVINIILRTNEYLNFKRREKRLEDFKNRRRYNKDLY